jgi:hypothetical protein
MTNEMAGVTRGEFDLLKDMVTATNARVENIDSYGTRGVAVVQTQLTEVVKDLSELKADVNSRFAAHEKQHELEKSERRSSRRWAIGTSIGFGAALAAILATVLDIMNHVHG